MPQFRIEATATYQHILVVEADNPEQAYRDATYLIRNGHPPTVGPGITFGKTRQLKVEEE